jgi:hypothetical protein
VGGPCLLRTSARPIVTVPGDGVAIGASGQRKAIGSLETGISAGRDIRAGCVGGTRRARRTSAGGQRTACRLNPVAEKPVLLACCRVGKATGARCDDATVPG